MQLEPSDWIAIVGIAITAVIGLGALFKKSRSKETNIKVDQRSGPFSKGKQTSNIIFKDTDD